MFTYPVYKVEIVIVLGGVILPHLGLANYAGRCAAWSDHRVELRVKTLEVRRVRDTSLERGNVHPADVADAIVIALRVLVICALLFAWRKRVSIVKRDKGRIRCVRTWKLTWSCVSDVFQLGVYATS